MNIVERDKRFLPQIASHITVSRQRDLQRYFLPLAFAHILAYFVSPVVGAGTKDHQYKQTYSSNFFAM